MIKTGIDDIPALPGLKDAITKKQSEIEFLDDLKKVPKVYAQGVYQSHSMESVSAPEDSVNRKFLLYTDSNGKELSKGRQDSFKDSVVREDRQSQAYVPRHKQRRLY